MSESIMERIQEGVVLLDGGMGTELIAHGFPQGACPETWNVEKPAIVQKIHKSYFDAGSDAVLTNSFGGNKIKLQSYGMDEKCYDLNHAAATLAAAVKSEETYVAGSMGPTGKFLKPLGEYTDEEFEDAYAEQANGLADGGVDFLLIETQYDLNEAFCALRGARKVTDKPVFVTMTFERGASGYNTMMGNGAIECVEELAKQDVPAVGTNCTLNSEDMSELVKVLRAATSLPLIAQANAGQPSITDSGKVVYSQGIEDYVRYIPRMIANGANLVGGCCGTNPDYIRRMAEIIKS